MSRNRSRWSIVAMLCATATAGYMARVNVSTAAPLLMKEFNLSQVAMGRIFSSFLLGYALFQIPSGAFADRWGARKVLTLAAWLWVLFTILQTGVGLGVLGATAGASITVFMIIRFLLGISASPAYPGAAQGVSRWVPPSQQGRANGIVIASIGLGSALAPPLVSNVMVHWGWRPALIISALPALIVAVIWFFIREPEKTVNEKPGNINETPDSRVAKGKMSSPAFILLTISYTLQGYVGYIFVAWFYLYLVQERHFDLLSGAWISSLPWVLSIISIPLGGYISDRLAAGKMGQLNGRRIIPMIGMIGSGLLISFGAHTSSAVIAALSLAFATALVLCVEGPFWTMMMRLSGSNSGTAGGVMNMGSNLGGLISPALTPLIAVWIGWENALHVAAVLSIIAGLLWIWIRPSISLSSGTA
ncbi:MAG: MFS transporter [Bacteroidales bacterium]